MLLFSSIAVIRRLRFLWWPLPVPPGFAAGFDSRSAGRAFCSRAGRELFSALPAPFSRLAAFIGVPEYTILPVPRPVLRAATLPVHDKALPPT